MASVENTETLVTVNLTAAELGTLYRTLEWACSDLDGCPDLSDVPGTVELLDFIGSTYYGTPEGRASIDTEIELLDEALLAFDNPVQV